MKLLKNNIFTKPNLKSLVLIIVLLGISGCGFWNNFKTYFNTYYNAIELFEETEKLILDGRKELFAYEEEKIPSKLVKNLDNVIKKTSSILQHNKESDYVEEALLLTGKSFYYQQNYSRALRKFNELLTITESELQLENKYWIARSYLQLKEFEKALTIFDEVKIEAIASEDDEILRSVYQSIIGYLIFQEEYETATSEINDYFELDLTDELKATVLYELGNMYSIIEDYESAQEAFAKVEDYSPTFEIDFNSKFEVAKLKKELGDVEKSLELLKELKNQDEYSDYWDAIDLEIGKIYYERDEIEDALHVFTEVDTTYDRTESAGIAGFYRAEILENYIHLYDSALVVYKRVTSLPVPDEIRNAARKKSGLLNKYIAYHKKIKELKTKLAYLTDENAFMLDSLDYLQKFKQDSLVFAQEQELKNKGNSRRSKQFKPNYKKPVRPIISADSVHSLNSKYYFELANLLFSEFDDPDSAFHYYDLSLSEKEDNPNHAQTLYAMGSYYLIKENKIKADSLFTLVYNNYQYDPIRNEAARHIGKPYYDFNKDPVEDKYNEAETYYDSLNYNLTIEKLFNIYNENPKSIYASKSLFTIGYILENDLDMPDSAASVYDILTKKYKSSEYSKSVNKRLGGYKQEQNRLQSIQDSILAAQAVLDSLKNSELIPIEAPATIDSVKTDTLINIKADIDTNDVKAKSELPLK